MGVVRLTSWSESKPQRERIYETTDLSQFRGKRLLIDAASFEFFLIEDVIGKQDLYYLGDHGPDFIAAARYFVLAYFHANGIHTTWVHDGSFNPAKLQTQQSRRAERAAPAVELNKKVFSHLRSPPSKWTRPATSGGEEGSAGPSFVELLRDLTQGLKEVDGWLSDATGISQALYLLLDELAAEGVEVEQIRTILEADAFIAAKCLNEGFDAVLSSDSDFLALDCPWIPLRSLRHRNAVPEAPCKFVPRGRFSEVMYDLALQQLAPVLSIVGLNKAKLEEQKGQLLPLDGFRALLPDFATISGTDFFSPVDPLSGQSRGFVKKVTIPLNRLGSKGQGPQQQHRHATTVTCDLTDKVACARFLLACLINGWVDAQGRLDVDAVLAPYLFPNAPKRLGEYLTAREQYDLTSGMARNQPPRILETAGLVEQYASFRLRHHHGALICPTAADEVDAEAAAADGPASTTSNNSSSKRPLRLRPLAVLLPLQQFGFPMRNLGLQRRIGYELLFYRAGERGAQGGEEGEEGVKACLSEPPLAPDEAATAATSPIEVIEEFVRLHPNTGSVDPRQPFLRRIVRLVEPEEEMPKGEGGEKEEGDWYRARFQKYAAELGPGFVPSVPEERRLAFFLEVMGYPPTEGREAVAAVLHALGPSSTAPTPKSIEEEVLALALALRTLLVAYGEDGGVAMFEPQQRNQGAYRALLYAAAEALLRLHDGGHSQPTAEAAAADEDHATPAAPPPLPASGAPFDPSNRGLRPRYPAWAERGGGGAGQLGARLRGVAMLMAYRACLAHVLDLSDLLGRVLSPSPPLAVDLSHLAVQRFLITEAPPEANDPADANDADADAASAERRLEAVAGALQVAVLVGIEREIAAFHPGYCLATK